ncbi:MAG: hypothetical protein ACE5H4_10670 [Candidatus Thorarchaeota archaeon]
MRVCSKCNKANLPTRKYCIRCGTTLITPPKRARAETSPAAEVPEIGKVTTEASIAREAEAARVTTDDRWVRPSEVAKNRVRAAAKAKRKTELEKAQEAFARAEEVGIEEEGSGVIETRMLRASEVRELLETSAELEAEVSSPEVPAPRMMEGSEPQPPEAAELMKPEVTKPEEVEEQILGAKSAFVAPKEEAPSEVTGPPSETGFSPSVSDDFTSAKYEQVEAAPGVTSPSDIPEVQAETVASPSATGQAPGAALEQGLDSVTICQKCGEATNVDMFEYPAEVYSAMGAARLKQARFMVVQGKSEETAQVLRIAIGMFLKANDETGLAETKRLVDSLTQG